jgi:MFS family permease
VLLIGITVFVVASALCGLAQADWWLISARAVQGMGAGVFLTASLSIVSNAFPPEERSKGIGVQMFMAARQVQALADPTL